MRRFAILLSALLLSSFSSPAQAVPGFGAGVQGSYWFPDLSATAQSITNGMPETEFDLKDDLGMGDENFPSGEAFLRFGRLHLRVNARVTGMAYSGNHLYEADAFASIVPFPFLRIQGGYRHIDRKVDEDDLVADVELSGPYVGAQLSFWTENFLDAPGRNGRIGGPEGA